MKKIVSLLMALCLIMATPLALATPDQPFKSGINYNSQYSDYGCRPSMLNFGRADLAPGESFYDAKTTTIKSGSAVSISQSLDKGMDYYVYAKWQNAESLDYNYIDAMLVMTDPDGDYYATYSEWTQYDLGRRVMCSWFLDVTNLLKRSREDNGGTLASGQYTFSLFFNNQSFRVTKVNFK